MIEEARKDAEKRMKKCVDALRAELVKIRTGRANTALLDSVVVSYYGNEVPLSQAANVAVQDSRTLTVSPWEKSMVPAIEKAIMSADLGLNPSTSGSVIRVPLPALTEERRKDLIKLVKHEGENGKVAVRNVRRDVLADIKALLKEKAITEDQEHKGQELIQKVTDKFVAEIDDVLKGKEAELMEF